MLSFYSWEFALSLDFDWDFISGKKKFRWPLVRLRNPKSILLFADYALVVLFCRSLRPAIRIDRDVSLRLVIDEAVSNAS